MEVSYKIMKILLADDHPMVRKGLRLMLERLYPQVEVFEACDYDEALTICEQQGNLTLILIDRIMPGMTDQEGLECLRKQCPALPIVIMSASDDSDHVLGALNQGARGYIPKSSSEEVMSSALQLVMSGGTYLPPSLLNTIESGTIKSGITTNTDNVSPSADLTSRQREVLAQLVKGKSNKQIAFQLDITEATVHTHTSAIFRLLNVSNRTEAVHVASRLNILVPDAGG